MKLRLLPALVVALPAAVLAAPSAILVVGDSLYDAAARLGAKTFGRTANHLLLEYTARTGAELPGTVIYPEPHLPLHIVPETPSGTAGLRVLFRDQDELLAQPDACSDGFGTGSGAKARTVSVFADMFRIPVPDRPHRLRRFSSFPLPAPNEPDTFIQRVIARVSPDSIRARMARLQAFRTRYSPTDSCRAAEQYLCDYLRSLGLDSATLDPYPVGTDTWRNVIGTKLGTVRPDKVLIVCGHMDAMSEDPWNLAPGMEDNASGTCVAMEAARVLAGVTLDYTVKFIAFTGEETGLNGSDHYARQARVRGEDIICAFNFDMVSWPGGSWGISLVGVPQAAHFVRYQGRMASLYTPLAYRVSFRSFPSDSRSFDNQGYAATSGYEYGSEPYIWYHTTGDTLGNCNMDLAADVTRMAVATLMSLGLAPLAPERFSLLDAGTGTSLVASWPASTEPDLAGYKLLWGRAGRNYSDSVLLGPVTSHLITGLLADTTYYASVVAIDSAGHESGASPEDSAAPGTVPRPPTSLAAMPFRYGMALSWAPNAELDLAGYNLYRRTGSGYQRLNQVLLTDTTYRDSGLWSDTMYRYFCTAVDSLGYESDSSRTACGKPISLDHGILLVDETRDGTGQPGNPSDEQQDRFYHALLDGCTFRDWDVARDGLPLAGDIGPFSTVLWHGDDYSQQEIGPALPGLANYLCHGGRLWLVGWKPVAALMSSNAYPFAFQPGQFPYDFLRLSRAEQSARPDFIGATGLLGYPDVMVESAKATPSLRGRLPYIDALLPRDAEAVLAYNSFSGDTFHGKPVGIRWLAEPGRAVFFGFPFYYVNEDDARVLARRVLDELGEPYGVKEEHSTLDAGRQTLACTPNPCRGSTVLCVSGTRPALSDNSVISLRVYDASGRAVLHSSLNVSNSLLPLDLRSLPAGVYIVRLTADSNSVTDKLVIQR